MTGERCVVLFLLGILAFNAPVLEVFASDGLIFGIPVMFVYLFAAWAVIIALAGVTTVSRSGAGRRDWRAD